MTIWDFFDKNNWALFVGLLFLWFVEKRIISAFEHISLGYKDFKLDLKNKSGAKLLGKEKRVKK